MGDFRVAETHKYPSSNWT